MERAMEKQSVWEGQCDEYPLDYYIHYPCGWWDPREPGECTCVFLDRLGYTLRDDTPICFIPRYPTRVLKRANLDMAARGHVLTLLRVTELRIDYIIVSGRVKFAGKLGDELYGDDDCGMLDPCEIMSVKAFRKMSRLVQYFLKHTQPKLHALRSNSFILKSMRLPEIQRLSLVNATTKCLLLSSTGSSQLSDATLVNCMSANTDADTDAGLD